MKALSALVLGLTLVGVATPAYAASEADCTSMWEKADTGKDGTLTGTEGQAYLDAVKAHTATAYDKNTDGQLTKEEFSEACKADVFKDVKL